MIRHCFLLTLFLITPPLTAGDKTDVKARESLVGVWSGYVVEGKGENPNQGPVKITLTITRETIAGKQMRDSQVIDHGEGNYNLDLTKMPLVLDAAKKRGKNTQTWLGIYSLDGDTLRWCVGRERPTDFRTQKGAFLLILKKQK
jgi:uncharacterized protein (TIGR03067 family)